jgi:hypothetical protein
VLVLAVKQILGADKFRALFYRKSQVRRQFTQSLSGGNGGVLSFKKNSAFTGA